MGCRFISIPKDMGTFNCGAFVAGIVRVSASLPLFLFTDSLGVGGSDGIFFIFEGCFG